MAAGGKRSALGKGLTALLSDSSTDPSGKNAVPVNSVSAIPVSSIEANPFQPRTEFDEEPLEELAQSIRTHGIIQPLTVRKTGLGRYQLISGERRLRASIRAGLKEVPAYVRVANDQEMLEMALVENIQRKELNAIEVALSYRRLVEECSLKQDELAERVGKKRATVANYLRLLKLPEPIQLGLRDEQLSMGHARALINVEDDEVQLELAKRVIEDSLSVRDTERLVQEFRQGKPKKAAKAKPAKKEEDGDKDDFQLWRYEIWERRLSTGWSKKVRVKAEKGEKGEVIIPFASEQELQRLSELLAKEEE